MRAFVSPREAAKRVGDDCFRSGSGRLPRGQYANLGDHNAANYRRLNGAKCESTLKARSTHSPSVATGTWYAALEAYLVLQA